MDRSRPSVLSAQQLARLLGGWAENRGRLPERLARALRQLVELGELAPGTRLPSERALASALVISRATVVSGYELLHGAGLLDSRPGSGHWIAREAAGRAGLGVTALFPWQHRLAPPESALGYPPSIVDLSAIAISASPVLHEVLSSVTAADWSSAIDEPKYLPLGWPPLRQAVAAECSKRGLPTSAQQILITSGAQQGLSLVAAALLQPGDVVVVEDPSTPGSSQCCGRLEPTCGRYPSTPTAWILRRLLRPWLESPRVSLSLRRRITIRPARWSMPTVVLG